MTSTYLTISTVAKACPCTLKPPGPQWTSIESTTYTTICPTTTKYKTSGATTYKTSTYATTSTVIAPCTKDCITTLPAQITPPGTAYTTATTIVYTTTWLATSVNQHVTSPHSTTSVVTSPVRPISRP
jgi:hypothetical protein